MTISPKAHLSYFEINLGPIVVFLFQIKTTLLEFDDNLDPNPNLNKSKLYWLTNQIRQISWCENDINVKLFVSIKYFVK